MTIDPDNGGGETRPRFEVEAQSVREEEPPEEDSPSNTDRPRPRMKGILILPSLITLGSTFCGFLAICYVADAMSLHAAGGAGAIDRAYDLIGRSGFLILLAMVFDALDGRVARLSHVTTEFGGQLDSLSDAISFGVAPAFIAKGLMAIHQPEFFPKLTLFACVLLVICAVLRLARYNVEHDNLVTGLDYFQGLPSPGAAGTIAAVALLSAQYRGDLTGLMKALPVVTFVLAILMVSRFPYVHATNRFLRGRKPFTYLVAVVCVIAFALLVGLEAVVGVLLVGYLLSGPVGYVVSRLTGKRGAEEGPLFD